MWHSIQKELLAPSGQWASRVPETLAYQLLNSMCMCSGPEQLHRVLSMKQRMKTKMKQEQLEMQQFSCLMKSVFHDKNESVVSLEDQLAEVYKPATTCPAMYNCFCLYLQTVCGA